MPTQTEIPSVLIKILPDLSKESVQSFAALLDAEIVRKNREEKIAFFVPYDKQKRFIHSPAPVKAFIGGNRSGKTTAGAVDVILECIGQHPLQQTGVRKQPPVFWRVVCVDFMNGIEKIILPKIKEWMPARFLINGDWRKSWKERTHTLTLANGSQIEFMSAQQDREKFQGTSRDGVWIDEEVDKGIWQECRMRLLDAAGRSILTMTPVNGMSWVYDDIYMRAGDPDIEVVVASTHENPHIDPVQIDAIAGGLTEEEQRVRLHGEFISWHGLIYKEFTDRPPHVIAPFEIPADWTRYIGIDPHLRTPTAAVFAACSNDGDIYVYDELFMEGLISEIAAAIKEKQAGVDVFSAVIDPASKQPNPVSGVSVRDEFARCGVFAKDAKKDVGVGINRVREYLKCDPVYNKPRLFVFDTCRQLRYEFMHYIWDDSSDTTRQMPRKKNDHLLDCLRYIIMEEPSYINPVKRRRSTRVLPGVCGY
ncbi:terminase family protein [bacterium]|nr:terminase family protein [bacterium]